ncbi:class E sortase [Phycicoccus endophyticus]|uniref:Class E sortase n=1 Tax=Phycicoccus endophyticus TaxID=1690220 RepID=A0A7G9R673_9MICO|nr:class E sortase [Phycicoccus endophyticus]QNN51098.1 class E sortase [Phycicoccus endophyticus]
MLITAGVVVLLFIAWQLWWTDITAERNQRQLVQALGDQFAGDGRGTVGGDAFPELDSEHAFAVLRVPRFGADFAQPVIEGVEASVLSLGVGHYEGTARPGAVGNFAVAGHRTTYGRPFHDIDTLVRGDRLIVETKPTIYVYEVTGHEIVRPWQTEVIAPVPDEPDTRATRALITLTSCHPKYSATYRYIVHGRLVKTIPRAEWHLADWTTVKG